MKLIYTLVPLAAAFVLPDEQMTSQMLAQKEPQTFHDRLQGGVDSVWSSVEESFKDAVAFSGNAIDNAINAASDAADKAKSSFECHMSMTKFDAQEWLDSAKATVEDFDLSTAANYTVFAPTDKAFEKIPEGHKKPSKELIKKVLAYHVSPNFYPAGRVLVTHTIPTALGEEALGGEPQRLRVGLGLKGLAVNFYSRVVAVDIFGTNGVIHGIDSILLPPPPATKIISLLPSEFSTLLLALEKTGLLKVIEDSPHAGGTLFAPSNWAFKKLGPKINAFLFSKYGEKYLSALLKYHVVANQTLYSDAFYNSNKPSESSTEFGTEDVPKGRFHVDLPTLLGDKSLSIDVARWGGFITIKINGFSSVAVQDGIAKDGVIHVVSSVLIPPKTPGGTAEEVEGEMDLEEFKDRLIPHFEDEL